MTYIYQKTEADLYLALREKMRRAGITNAYPDAVSNILNEFITEELYALSNEFNNKVSEYSLVTAEGEALDRLVNELYALNRFAPTKARANGSIRFRNTSNTDIEIPSGTLVSSGSTFSEEGRVYEVVDTVSVGAGLDAFGSVVAIAPGSVYNVGANVLESLDLETSNIEVANIYPIVNGSDLESDEDFRARALAHLNAKAAHNLDFMKLNLLEVPGVLNTRYMQGYNGLGTMTVFATTAGNKTNAELRRLVEGRLSELRLPGDAITYEEGTRVIFDIAVGVTNTRNYSNEEISQIKSEIRQLIANEFVAAKTKGTISFRDISASVINRMRSAYAFTSSNTSGSIFKNIRVTSIAPEERAEAGRPTTTISQGALGADFSLRPNEIPEIGDLSVEVELIL